MIVNPIGGFYEWYLTFMSGMPLPFHSFQSAVWGFVIVFSLVNIYFRLK